VLFIALLAGGEGVRISAQAKDFTFAQDLLARQKSMASQDSAGTILVWHNDVCRSRELNGGNVSAAASRYASKYVKLQQLEKTLQGDECSKGVSCVKRWIEFKSRVTHFKSCVVVFNQEHETNGEASPASVLVKTMTSEQTSFAHLIKNSLVTVANAMEKNGMSPVGDKCGFYPARLNITGALHATKNASEAGDLMREQLLGKDCDATASQEYLNTLDKAAKRTAYATMAIVNRVVDLTHRLNAAKQKGEAAVQEEVANAVVDAEAIVKDVRNPDADSDSNSLLELGLTPGSGLYLLLVLVIAIVMTFVTFFIWAGIVQGLS
jgi:hypothetical protein